MGVRGIGFGYARHGDAAAERAVIRQKWSEKRRAQKAAQKPLFCSARKPGTKPVSDTELNRLIARTKRIKEAEEAIKSRDYFALYEELFSGPSQGKRVYSTDKGIIRRGRDVEDDDTGFWGFQGLCIGNTRDE